MLNSRICGYGDYETPEQGVPITLPKGPWELCMTMNDSWGYEDNDLNYKTSYQIIRVFADVIGAGGSLLLGIGPRADGTLPAEQVQIFARLGRWTRKPADAGIPLGHFYGPTTLASDRKTLFLFLPHRPSEPVVLKGLKNPVNRIRIVGNGTKLAGQVLGKQYWSTIPGILYIEVPSVEVDEDVTVLALQCEAEVDLHR